MAPYSYSKCVASALVRFFSFATELFAREEVLPLNDNFVTNTAKYVSVLKCYNTKLLQTKEYETLKNRD